MASLCVAVFAILEKPEGRGLSTTPPSGRGLIQLITSPTRITDRVANMRDLAFTNNTDIVTPGTLSSFGNIWASFGYKSPGFHNKAKFEGIRSAGSQNKF